MTSRTFIIGGTVREAREWCRKNGVQPYAHTTIIATHERAIRGHTIRREDRVEWLTPVSRALVENVAIAQRATGANHTPPPPPCPRCGKPEDSFACRVRHVAVDVSNLRREREQ